VASVRATRWRQPRYSRGSLAMMLRKTRRVRCDGIVLEVQLGHDGAVNQARGMSMGCCKRQESIYTKKTGRQGEGVVGGVVRWRGALAVNRSRYFTLARTCHLNHHPPSPPPADDVHAPPKCRSYEYAYPSARQSPATDSACAASPQAPMPSSRVRRPRPALRSTPEPFAEQPQTTLPTSSTSSPTALPHAPPPLPSAPAAPSPRPSPERPSSTARTRRASSTSRTRRASSSARSSAAGSPATSTRPSTCPASSRRSGRGAARSRRATPSTCWASTPSTSTRCVVRGRMAG